MHELTLMKKMMTILERETAEEKVGMVKKVHLEIGVLQQVVPDLMATAFEHIPKSEKLRNARIDISVMPAKVNCADCKKETIVKEMNFRCGICQGENVTVISGNELILKGVEW